MPIVNEYLRRILYVRLQGAEVRVANNLVCHRAFSRQWPFPRHLSTIIILSFDDIMKMKDKSVRWDGLLISEHLAWVCGWNLWDWSLGCGRAGISLPCLHNHGKKSNQYIISSSLLLLPNLQGCPGCHPMVAAQPSRLPHCTFQPHHARFLTQTARICKVVYPDYLSKRWSLLKKERRCCRRTCR